MASSGTTIPKKIYLKRSGTSGIQGHLYETKLLSLIYFRAIHDVRIKEFHLATNVDKLGSFDDICFRAKVKGIDKPLAVFIQAKHRENNSGLTLNSKSDLVRHFKSYMEIRSKFKPNNKDVLFDGPFSGTECLFVIYTTEKGDRSAQKHEGRSAIFLNALIQTEVVGSGLQPIDDNKHTVINQILLDEEMTALARLIAKCIHGELNDIQMLIQDELVLRYHVTLAQKVFDVSVDQSEGYRDAQFRRDFFDNNEEHVQLFKEELCLQILKRQKIFSGSSSRNFTDTESEFQKIASILTYENRKFDVLDKIESESYILDKNKIKSQEAIKRTFAIEKLQFRVPAWFGNKDLTIRGDDRKKERKLIDLASKVVGLIEKSKPSNIVILEEESVRESMGDGFLQLNGGIASAVGNLLVLDDDSKLLKFNENYESLGKLAKMLFDQLSCKIENLYEYKFDVRAKIFPKFSFAADEYTKNIVSDFSKKLLFYTSQAKEAKVEKILISEIEKKLLLEDEYTLNIKSNTIFLKYHDEIQKWWIDKVGEYLTEEGSLYRNAENYVLSQSLMSFINMITMQKINIKKYDFTKDAVNSIQLDDQPSGTVILTKNLALTVAKLINHVIKKDCVVLDMQYILNLPIRSNETLQALHALIDLYKEKTFVVVCDKAIFRKSSEEVAGITDSLRRKNVIIILNDQDFVKNAKIYFTLKDNVINDKRNNLIDMSEGSQKTLLDNTNVIFQGVEVGLGEVLDDESHGLVGEFVLYKLMQSDSSIIGKPANPIYNENIYIERSVKCLKVIKKLGANDRIVEEGESKSVSTLHDPEDDVILVIGDPGMGKSTLLTQLSLKTKILAPTIWILRINLLEYSKQFFEWKTNETVIDILKCLNFLCQVAISEESIKNNDVQITLEESNGNISLKDCDGDEWIVFELKMFLHYYNTKQLIILFDGFDEICPTYAHEVLSLIKAVTNLRQKHKIWITSRSYDKIITDLELQFLYKMEPLNNVQQDLYLSKYWQEKNLSKKFKQKEVRNNISDFCRFMLKSDDLFIFKKKSHLTDESINEKPMLAVYLSLFKHLKPVFGDCKDLDKELALQFSGLVANPLHLKMLAEHLSNQIEGRYNLARDVTRRDERQEEQYKIKWDLDVNIFEIYERFLENKLKIRFQEKNQTDIYKPKNIELYKREYANSKDKLKKLAAYVVYNKRLLNKHELNNCEEIIDKLKEGQENTDIICNVVNDIPIFVHSTFAEYYAIEYICDLIKNQRNLKYIYDFMLNVMFFKLNKNILVILDAKIKIDKELTTLIEKNKGIVFSLLQEQGKITKRNHGCIKSSLCEAVRLGLRNLAFLLFSINEAYLYETNLLDFIEIVKDTNMLMIAVKMGFDELLIKVINQVRMISESKLSALFENIEIFDKNVNFARESTSDLVQKLHANVWTRMNIVPDWENLAELSGQIYFV